MRKLPKYITLEEFNLLVNSIEKEKPCNYKKHLLAMILGFKAGMRISEIVGYGNVVPPLSPEQIDLEQHSIKIISGKGQKDRVVPLPKEINASAIKLLPINLKRRTIQSFYEKHCMTILNKKLSFHSLRHGFGSHLAAGGRPIHEIQMLMGHSRMDTTGIYLHANPKQAIDGARELF